MAYDPELEAIKAERRAVREAAENASKLAERRALLAHLAVLRAEQGSLLPGLRQDCGAKQAAAWAAHIAADEAGLRLYQEENRITLAIGHALNQLGDRPTPAMTAELARYDAEISRCQTGAVALADRAEHEAYTRAVQDARFRVAALGSLPDAEITEQIKAIRASLPGTAGGRTWSVASMVEQAGAELRAAIASRFTSN